EGGGLARTEAAEAHDGVGEAAVLRDVRVREQELQLVAREVGLGAPLGVPVLEARQLVAGEVARTHRDQALADRRAHDLPERPVDVEHRARRQALAELVDPRDDLRARQLVEGDVAEGRSDVRAQALALIAYHRDATSSAALDPLLGPLLHGETTGARTGPPQRLHLRLDRMEASLGFRLLADDEAGGGEASAPIYVVPRDVEAAPL